MSFPLTVQAVQVLFVAIPLVFAIILFVALRRVHFPTSSSHYQIQTALITAGVSVLFAVFSGWFMWWLSLNGPSGGNLSYRGNGALDAVIPLAIGVALSLGITLYYRAWWAALAVLVIDPLAFIETYSLLVRFAAG